MELTEIIQEIEATIKALDECHIALTSANLSVANTRSDYEEKKNGEILRIKTMDGKQPTAQVITAMYRDAFKTERLAWQLADAEAESQKALQKGILAKLNALQSLLRVQESEMKISSFERTA